MELNWRELSVLLVIFAASSTSGTTCPNKCKCSANFATISCQHQQLSQIPDGIPIQAHQLYLGYNLITRLPENSFSTLVNLTEISLKNNELVEIQAGAFSGLARLKYLYLTQNSLKLIGDRAFDGLVSLQQLHLQQNQLIQVPNLSAMSSLTRLSFANNKLKSIKIETNPPVTLRSLVFSNNPINKISADDFAPLKNCSLTKVDLSRCDLKSLEPGAFGNFPHLQSLSVSYNSNLQLAAIASLIKDLANSSVLFALDISGSISEEIPPNMFSSLQSVKLKQLSLSHTTKCKVLQNGTFSGLPSLNFLDLSHSDIEQIETGAFFGLKDLQRLDMQNLNLGRVPYFPLPTLQQLNLNHNSIDSFGLDDYLPFELCNSLKILNCSSSTIREIVKSPFQGLANLEHLDLSSNRIAGNAIGAKVLAQMPNLKTLSLKKNNLKTVDNEDKLLFGLNRLEFLDMSDNNCRLLPEKFFAGTTSLTELRMSKNNMQSIWDNSPSILNVLRNLQHIDLDHSQIKVIPSQAFKGVIALKTIMMSSNEVSTWTADVFNFSRVQYINMSSNSISLVNKSSLLGLPSGITLDLHNNPFSCYCDMIWFRNQISAHFNGTVPGLSLVNIDDYICNTPEDMAGKRLVSFNPKLIMKICNPPPWNIIIPVAVTTAALFLIGSFIAVYKNYWKIRFFIYDTCQTKHQGRAPGTYQSLEGEAFKHHLVISYCSSSVDDRDWVTQTLMRRLDKDLGGRYDVYIEDKVMSGQRGLGALPGIQPSRKCIAVVSKAYTEERRCMYELRMAISTMADRGSLDDVIIILLEPSGAVKLPPLMRQKIKEEKHLTWPQQDEQGLDLFWRELIQQIGPPESAQCAIDV